MAITTSTFFGTPLRETTSWSEGAPATSTMLGGVDRISTSRMGPDVSAWPIDVFHPSSSHMGACQDLESQAGRGHQDPQDGAERQGPEARTADVPWAGGEAYGAQCDRDHARGRR